LFCFRSHPELCKKNQCASSSLFLSLKAAISLFVARVFFEKKKLFLFASFVPRLHTPALLLSSPNEQQTTTKIVTK